LPQVFHSLRHIHIRPVESLDRASYEFSLFAAKAGPAHPDNIYADYRIHRTIARRTKRRHVLGGNATAGDHGQATHFHELVNGNKAAYKRPGTNLHITAEDSIVGYDNVVSERTVVGHVCISHQEALVTYPGNGSGFCAPVNRHTFANYASFAHFDKGLSAIESQVLGKIPNHSPCMDTAIRLKSTPSKDRHPRTQAASVPDPGASLDVGERPDIYVFAKFGTGLYYCCCMMHSKFSPGEN
jgi:hypothetical protein